MYNLKDIERLEAEIANAIKAEGSDETPGIESLVGNIASPNTGLIYKPGENGAPGHLVIAEGWIANNNGDIVKLEDVSGPGAQKK